jgi:hypothetical protein
VPLGDKILDKLPDVENFADEVRALTPDDWKRLGQASPQKKATLSTARVGKRLNNFYQQQLRTVLHQKPTGGTIQTTLSLVWLGERAYLRILSDAQSLLTIIMPCRCLEFHPPN